MVVFQQYLRSLLNYKIKAAFRPDGLAVSEGSASGKGEVESFPPNAQTSKLPNALSMVYYPP